MDCIPPRSSLCGIFLARTVERVFISFSGGYSWAKDWAHNCCFGRWILYHWATREDSLVCSPTIIWRTESYIYWVPLLAQTPLSKMVAEVYTISKERRWLKTGRTWKSCQFPRNSTQILNTESFLSIHTSKLSIAIRWYRTASWICLFFFFFVNKTTDLFKCAYEVQLVISIHLSPTFH